MIMKMYKILCLMLILLAASCSEETQQLREQSVPIAFTLKTEAPVMAYPAEKVSYSFDIEYEKGVSEVFCRIGSKEIEGSRKSFEGAPVKVEYSFEYVPTDVQAGTTIDFVLEALGADGLGRTTDIPLYVRATKADIVIAIPDEAPAEFMIGSPLEFTVAVSSGIDMKHICLYRNEQLVEGSLIESFENPKAYDFQFSYEPSALDVGAPVIFKFEVMDTRGNIVTQNYSVNFTKPASLELNEYLNVTMGYQRCISAGPYFASSNGQVYNIVGANEYSSIIDIVIYYSGNATTQGLAITSATSANATGSSMYGGSAVTYMGGTEEDFITNWTDPITTKFKLVNGSIKGENASELTLEEFAEINTKQEIIDLWDNSASKENVTVLMVQANSIFVFKTSQDRYGLFRVVKFERGNTTTATFDFKLIK